MNGTLNVHSVIWYTKRGLMGNGACEVMNPHSPGDEPLELCLGTCLFMPYRNSPNLIYKRLPPSML